MQRRNRYFIKTLVKGDIGLSGTTPCEKRYFSTFRLEEKR